MYQISSDRPCGLHYSTWVINYASKAEETVVYSLKEPKQFSADPYIKVTMPNKIVCIPAHLNQRLRALLYVENSTSDNEYTNEPLAKIGYKKGSQLY
jgi:predicted transglutaminase-like protease